MEAGDPPIIAWSEELGCGLEAIDGEHRRLIDLINCLDAQRRRGGPLAQLQNVLAELRAYALDHFEHEHQLMLRWPVPAAQREAHLRAHDGFVRFLGRAAAALEADPADVTEQLLAFLVDWLLHHIRGVDRQLAQAVLDASGAAAGATGRHAEPVQRDHLVDRLSHLYEGMAERNFELLELNRQLRREVELRTRVEDELRISQARAASLYRYAPIALWEMDWHAVWDGVQRLRADGVVDLGAHLGTDVASAQSLLARLRVVDVNDATLRLFGAPTKSRLLGDMHRRFDASTMALFADMLVALDAGAQDFQGEASIRGIDGAQRHLAFSLYIVPQEVASRDRIMVAAADITERKLAHDRLQHLALHDALTDLPNRALFHDRLQQALALCKRHGTALALLNIDLDRFKPVNDEHGHAVGDLVLQQVARRLLAIVRASDTVARMGGDEFCLLLPSVADADAAMRVARQVCAVLSEPVEVEGLSLGVGASVGVALTTDANEPASVLIRRADAAMYCAKQAGGQRAHLHDATDAAS